MKSKIIGQGYNLEENTSTAKELIELFNSDKYDKFTCLVAFASYGGITALTPHILRAKTNDVTIKIILLILGIVICQNLCQPFPPSISAASY